MQGTHARIKILEREIDRVKTQFHFGRMSLAISKKRILELERELALLVGRLPEHEKEIYLLRKEFGKEF